MDGRGRRATLGEIVCSRTAPPSLCLASLASLRNGQAGETRPKCCRALPPSLPTAQQPPPPDGGRGTRDDISAEDEDGRTDRGRKYEAVKVERAVNNMRSSFLSVSLSVARTLAPSERAERRDLLRLCDVICAKQFKFPLPTLRISYYE